MKNYHDDTYGETMAPVYDKLYADFSPQSAVEGLARLAGKGPILELGIGTGRLALPLREKGFRVCGIDTSPAMVKQLRAKKGGKDLPVHIGTFARFVLKESFSLVFVGFNTFFGLTTQREQIDCFKSVAGVLGPRGRFVIEAFVPDLSRFSGGQSVRVFDVEIDGVWTEYTRYSALEQKIETQIVHHTPKGSRFYPLCARFAWPAELDAMAEVAGLELENRWGGWKEEPFVESSRSHVSVYRFSGKPSRKPQAGKHSMAHDSYSRGGTD